MFFFLMQYVAYADGLIRAYNIHTYAVHYTLQREMTIDSFFFLCQDGARYIYESNKCFNFILCSVDNTIKLIGAGAFAFHPTLEWIFVGDRRGTLLAWDVSIEKPSMIGM